MSARESFFFLFFFFADGSTAGSVTNPTESFPLLKTRTREGTKPYYVCVCVYICTQNVRACSARPGRCSSAGYDGGMGRCMKKITEREREREILGREHHGRGEVKNVKKDRSGGVRRQRGRRKGTARREGTTAWAWPVWGAHTQTHTRECMRVYKKKREPGKSVGKRLKNELPCFPLSGDSERGIPLVRV